MSKDVEKITVKPFSTGNGIIELSLSEKILLLEQDLELLDIPYVAKLNLMENFNSIKQALQPREQIANANAPYNSTNSEYMSTEVEELLERLFEMTEEYVYYCQISVVEKIEERKKLFKQLKTYIAQMERELQKYKYINFGDYVLKEDVNKIINQNQKYKQLLDEIDKFFNLQEELNIKHYLSTVNKETTNNYKKFYSLHTNIFKQLKQLKGE